MRREPSLALRAMRTLVLAAFLASFHFIWLVKSDIREPLLYFALFSVLMLLRLPSVEKKAPLIKNWFRSVKA